jgi:3-phosphoglycerate kinase
MKSLNQLNFENKKALVRCDFNVPLDEKGNVSDDFRIKEALPSIKYLLASGAKVILMSHLGEPEGKFVSSLSLAPVSKKLSSFLNIPVDMASDCVGEEVEQRVAAMNGGNILLLENLRFHKEEKENDSDFAKKLARLGDIYVNEAFSVSHRKHASIVGVPEFLPSCAGLLFEKEIKILRGLIDKPRRPLVVIIGGKKVETKAALIEKFAQVADWVLVSGLIQKEINEKDLKFKNAEKMIPPVGDLAALDINQESVKIFDEKIKTAKMIFWNGPFGKTEDERYASGTKAIADAIINSQAYSVIGGGETLEFFNKLGLIEKFNHVSSGGGAMLDFLTDGRLPGIEALG